MEHLLTSFSDLCNPLKDLGIHFVHFIRIYNDHQRFSLSNKIDLTRFIYDFYSKNYSSNDVTYLTKVTNKEFQIIDFKKEKNTVAHFAQNHSKTLYDAFLYQNRTADYTDYVYFSGQNETNEELYVNNHQIFMRFYYFLLDKGEEIFLDAQKHLVKPQLLPNNLSITSPQKHDLFIKQTPIKRFFINDKCYLTKRECECLAWIGVGKTYEEVSLILGTATRTIINHVESIKDKLNLRTVNEIIRFSIQSGLPELFAA